MGKSKKRIIAKAKNAQSTINMTRDAALEQVCSNLKTDPTSISAKNLITLFGLSAEELAENGISYEILRSLDGLVS